MAQQQLPEGLGDIVRTPEEEAMFDDEFIEGVISNAMVSVERHERIERVYQGLAEKITDLYQISEVQLPPANWRESESSYLTRELVRDPDGRLTTIPSRNGEAPLSGRELLYHVLRAADDKDGLAQVNTAIGLDTYQG